MILDIIIAGSCGGAGICCGWVMHALHRAGGPSPSHSEQTRYEDGDLSEGGSIDFKDGTSREANAASGKNVLKNADGEVLKPEKVATVADRIRSFASIVAANVDEHQTKVDAVNGVLSASDLSGAPTEIVVAVEQLLAANETMRSQLEESQKRLREQTKQLESAEQRAETDALTQLSNRGAFDKRLDEQYAKGCSSAGVLAILDIDFFKKFNDEHGHRIGDEVLRSVASMLEARLQPYGLVARFGGEEFCVMIDNVDYAEAIDLIERTRIAVSSREIRFEGKRLKVSMSVGIGVLQPNQSSDEWLQRVDDALYRSKEAGRNCAHYIDADRIVRVGTIAEPNPMDLPAIAEPVSTDSTNAVSENATATGISSSNTGASIADASNANKLKTSGLAAEPAGEGKRKGKAVVAVTDEPTPIQRTNAEEDPLVAAIASDALDVEASVAGAVDRTKSEEVEDVEAKQLSKLADTLRESGDTERPKGLTYLPDRETMIDGIVDVLASQTAPNRTNRLMAVTLSGQPGGSTMRSLLQLVRAAMRSQDRIGCLNHSTLLISMPECDESEALLRAEQICGAASSVGLTLASAEKNQNGERLSIGILGLEQDGDASAAKTGRRSVLSPSMINHAIAQVQAVAMLGARVGGSGSDGKSPILSRPCQLASVPAGVAQGS